MWNQNRYPLYTKQNLPLSNAFFLTAGVIEFLWTSSWQTFVNNPLKALTGLRFTCDKLSTSTKLLLHKCTSQIFFSFYSNYKILV